MDNVIGLAAIWSTLLLLSFAFFKSAWLNQRGSQIAHWTQRLAWIGFASVAIAVLTWSLTGAQPLNATVFGLDLFGMKLDALSATLLLLVTFLGGVVLRYSRSYLSSDARHGHFTKWMAVTLGSVSLMVVSPGLLQFGLAWIATSLSLHRLLVFFEDRKGTEFSARKKFFVSRCGDISLLAAFIGITAAFGSQSFSAIFASLENGSVDLTGKAWIGWFIVIGALLKSAQFPFHTWLPDTMGTPTPVSALMHAGIINGGGILAIRLSPVLVETPGALSGLLIVGAITAVFGSFIMLTQTSVKRSLAYSTIAQMGFMLMQCGLGAFHLAALHLVAHSLYKAYAFLSSGSSVASIKTLRTRESQKPLPLFGFFISIALSLALVAGLMWLFGIDTAQKPGALALGAIVALAVAQYISGGIRQARTEAIAKSAVVATAIASVYFALAVGSQSLFANTLPQIPVVANSAEWILAIGLFVSLALTLRLQEAHDPDSPQPHWKAALYVHALNGFYLNTIANRMVRFVSVTSK